MDLVAWYISQIDIGETGYTVMPPELEDVRTYQHSFQIQRQPPKIYLTDESCQAIADKLMAEGHIRVLSEGSIRTSERQLMMDRLWNYCKTDVDNEILQELLVTSGILWLCHDCGFLNEEVDHRCGDCGEPKVEQ